MEPTRATRRRSTTHSALRPIATAFGYALMALWSTAAAVLTHVAQYLGNCNWGLFGTETGPSYEAFHYTLDGDLLSSAIGWAVASFPWLLVAFATHDERSARVCWTVVGVLGAGAALLAAIHASDPAGYWSNVCS